LSKHLFDVLTIIAILTGPVVALALQRFSEERRDKRQQRFFIFRTLMQYRATVLNHNYVQALNLIDIVFNADTVEEKAIRTAWKVLLDHLSTPQLSPAALERQRQLSANLLLAMGKRLGYELDEVYLKTQAYQPVAHAQIEAEQNELRSLALALLKDQRRLPIAVFADDFASLEPPKGNPI
jgi:hypothetical protein